MTRAWWMIVRAWYAMPVDPSPPVSGGPRDRSEERAQRTRWWAVQIALLMLLSPTAPRVGAMGRSGGGPPPGSAAPAFALPDTHGSLHSLDDYRGQVVMLNFWAFWCDTWKAEMPSLKEMAGRQDDLGFQMLAISVDGTRLPEFQGHTQGGHVPFPVLLDSGRQVTARYHVSHVPTVVIIDRWGRVRYTAYGYPGNQVILSVLRRLESQGGRTTGG